MTYSRSVGPPQPLVRHRGCQARGTLPEQCQSEPRIVAKYVLINLKSESQLIADASLVEGGSLDVDVPFIVALQLKRELTFDGGEASLTP